MHYTSYNKKKKSGFMYFDLCNFVNLEGTILTKNKNPWKKFDGFI